MTILSNANIKAFADKLAAVCLELDTDLGSGSQASTPSKTAADLVTSVLALADSDQIEDLLLPARHVASLAKAAANYRMVRPLLEGLDRHLGGLSDYALDQDFRLHYALKNVFPADVKIFFAPATSIATYAVVDAETNSGTLTPGTSLDGSYGKSNMIVKVINQTLGAVDLVLTLTMTKQDGTSENKTVTVAANSAVGTTFDIGTHDTDMYVDCSAVAFTGGTDGDDVEILSEAERSVSL